MDTQNRRSRFFGFALMIAAVTSCQTADFQTRHGLDVHLAGASFTAVQIEALTERLLEALECFDPETYAYEKTSQALKDYQPQIFMVHGAVPCGSGQCRGKYQPQDDSIELRVQPEIYATVLTHELIHFFRRRVAKIKERNDAHDPDFYETYWAVDHVASQYTCFDMSQDGECEEFIHRHIIQKKMQAGMLAYRSTGLLSISDVEAQEGIGSDTQELNAVETDAASDSKDLENAVYVGGTPVDARVFNKERHSGYPICQTR